MRPLIAVDWGTSSLRAARLDETGRALEERSSPRGILTVEAGGFPQVLQDLCGDWLQQPEMLCLVSGMAGSRQGWVEAPYAPCPAGFDSLAAQLTWIEPGRIGIVPGLSCSHVDVPDVLRGEEVQVFGAMGLAGTQDGVFVLPGTHSKWVTVRAGAIDTFSTFMAGEFYALLRQHSILARTMPPEDGAIVEHAFLQGMDHARASGSILRSAFSARTLALFGRLEAGSLPSYLSGLVIGEELRVQPPPAAPVILIGSETLTRRYALGLQHLGIASRTFGAEATWQGLARLARAMEVDA